MSDEAKFITSEQKKEEAYRLFVTCFLGVGLCLIAAEGEEKRQGVEIMVDTFVRELTKAGCTVTAETARLEAMMLLFHLKLSFTSATPGSDGPMQDADSAEKWMRQMFDTHIWEHGVTA